MHGSQFGSISMFKSNRDVDGPVLLDPFSEVDGTVFWLFYEVDSLGGLQPGFSIAISYRKVYSLCGLFAGSCGFPADD